MGLNFQVTVTGQDQFRQPEIDWPVTVTWRGCVVVGRAHFTTNS